MFKVKHVDTGEVNPGTGLRRLAEQIENKVFYSVDPIEGQCVVDVKILYIKDSSTLNSDRFEAIVGIEIQ